MKYITNSTINTVIGIAGLIGIGYGLAMHSELAKVSKRLDKGIDKLVDNIDVDISDEIINKAVNKAVTEAARRAVTNATNEAINEVRRDIRREVAAAVDKEYDNIKDSVLKEITVSASKIDVDRVRKNVEKAAYEAAMKKFEVNLDGILQKFNTDLDNTAKIYSTIKSMMNPAPAPVRSEYVFRV